MCVEAIEKLTFKLLLTVNGPWLEVGIPIKSITFQRAHELFDHKVIISASIIASFHKVGNILAGVSFAIEFFETSTVGSLLAFSNNQSFENTA